MPPGPAFLAKPWFWALFVGVLFCVPLIKGLGAELPEALPGLDRLPSEFELADENGELVSLADLQGYLVVATEMPLASGSGREHTMRTLRSLRRRLRGLGSAVVFVSLCHGGEARDLTALLDKWTARKPVNVFLLDPERQTTADLRHEAGSESADWFLLDRHGRLRGAYGVAPVNQPQNMDAQAEAQRLVAVDAEMDRLVWQAGQLANWAGSDTAPGGP